MSELYYKTFILVLRLQVSVSLLNITSSQTNLTVVLNVKAATEADAGEYQCKTTSAHLYSFSRKVKVTLTGAGTAWKVRIASKNVHY